MHTLGKELTLLQMATGEAIATGEAVATAHIDAIYNFRRGQVMATGAALVQSLRQR